MNSPCCQNKLFVVPPRSSLTKNQELLNNPSQVVPLDKDLALPEHVKLVDVVAMRRCRIITPAGEAWDSWLDQPRSEPGLYEPAQSAALCMSVRCL